MGGANKNWSKMTKMTKIKVVPNCLKWRENWSKLIFGFFSYPTLKNKYINRVPRKVFVNFVHLLSPPQLPQSKSWHSEVRCSHSAHLTQPCCDFLILCSPPTPPFHPKSKNIEHEALVWVLQRPNQVLLSSPTFPPWVAMATHWWLHLNEDDV